jgi:hypothetical protein
MNEGAFSRIVGGHPTGKSRMGQKSSTETTTALSWRNKRCLKLRIEYKVIRQ